MNTRRIERQRRTFEAISGSLTSWLIAPLIYPALRIGLGAKSEIDRVRYWSQPTRIHWETPPGARPILVLALYEKGRLRPDVLRLLDTARDQGFSVVAVNTLKLMDPETLRDRIDTYIERPNYGRDFGSYRTAFLHIHERGWDRECPRLLMLNDSVFYARRHLAAFLRDMRDHEAEVLGATENYEINYHLGSFAIAMSGKILRHPRIRNYWRRYRLTDVRPSVIHGGEMKLSRALRRAVSSEDQMTALFNARRFIATANQDPAFLDEALKNSCVSTLIGWKRWLPSEFVADYMDQYTINRLPIERLEIAVDTDVERVAERFAATSASEIINFLKLDLSPGSTIDEAQVRSVLAARLGEVFLSGSQIHRNSAILLMMGLPIVKLDGLYRGTFVIEDVQAICRHLSPEDAKELRDLLMTRPFGGDILFGWRRMAFMRGLL